MKCQNCGTEFEGNSCPNCNVQSTDEVKNLTSEEVKNENNYQQIPSGNNYSFQSTEPPKERKKGSKRLIFEIIGVILLLVFMFSSFSKVPEKDYAKLQDDYEKLVKTNKEDETKIASLSKMESEYAKYKERMKPYEQLDVAEAEARQIEAEKVSADKKAAEEKAAADKKAAEEKAAADKKAAEEQAAAEAAAAKAAEEARGYETGITYDQLARTPDDFMGQKVKFYGKVIQVIEDASSVQIRLAVDDNYDTILLCEYSTSIVSSRVLKDDHITIYGSSVGTISYQSTMGGNITIPGVYVDKIE